MLKRNRQFLTYGLYLSQLNVIFERTSYRNILLFLSSGSKSELALSFVLSMLWRFFIKYSGVCWFHWINIKMSRFVINCNYCQYGYLFHYNNYFYFQNSLQVVWSSFWRRTTCCRSRSGSSLSTRLTGSSVLFLKVIQLFDPIIFASYWNLTVLSVIYF